MKIRNWKKFQHYKDRLPPWIKLHKGLLDNPDWNGLSPFDSKVLIMLWLLASEDKELQGVLPDTRTISFRLRLPEEKIRESLNNLSKWLDDSDLIKKEPWPSRYVGKKLRNEILARDGNCCVFCSASKKLEIDHVIPVSKGGRSERDNLQVLCRSCNRKKRASVTRATQSMESATQIKNCCTTETETETETELLAKEEEVTKGVWEMDNSFDSDTFGKMINLETGEVRENA